MQTEFYRTILTVEVLSDRPLTDQHGYNLSLEDIASEGAYGDFSLVWKVNQMIVGRKELADLLIEQGSEPGFLLGDCEEGWE